VNKEGRLTVRLQGLDAPELHYRPIVARLAADAREALRSVNGSFRQHGGESSTLALRELVQRQGLAELDCKITSQVQGPSDLFDCYGRLVGDIHVKLDEGWVNVNHWLLEQGWAFPALYESMTNSEISTVRQLASEAASCWRHRRVAGQSGRAGRQVDRPLKS
jgi:endonuclease YncB( thermonuclease family)